MTLVLARKCPDQAPATESQIVRDPLKRNTVTQYISRMHPASKSRPPVFFS